MPRHRWWVYYNEIIYDNGTFSWIGYHHTRVGALIAAWWVFHISSWGGRSVKLMDKRYRKRKRGIA